MVEFFAMLKRKKSNVNLRDQVNDVNSQVRLSKNVHSESFNIAARRLKKGITFCK